MARGKARQGAWPWARGKGQSKAGGKARGMARQGALQGKGQGKAWQGARQGALQGMTRGKARGRARGKAINSAQNLFVGLWYIVAMKIQCVVFWIMTPYSLADNYQLCVILDFQCGADEVLGLLGCCAALIGPILKVGRRRCPESLTNYQSTFHNIPEERKPNYPLVQGPCLHSSVANGAGVPYKMLLTIYQSARCRNSEKNNSKQWYLFQYEWLLKTSWTRRS